MREMMNGVLSPSVNNLRLGLIGNPENRRVRDFRLALEEIRHSTFACLAYETLLQAPETLAGLDVDFLRIDSPGENETVTKALITRGGGPLNPALEFGEVAFLKEYHRGYCDVLEIIGQRGLPCLNSPGDIAVMFDKWKSHQRFVENDVARPPAELAPSRWEDLRDLMRAGHNGRLFLKPLHGSSASGVCALRWTPQHQQLIAPLRIESARGQAVLMNSLDVRIYTSPTEIELILGKLLPQGMISERWIPKLTLSGGAVDLRVLVIAGEARHWVVRQSRHPMTNLHLGNQRGDQEELRNVIGDEKLNAAFRLAEKAAACFPESLYAGVDVLLDTRHRALIGEINAFGDLLPRLIHRDESPYLAIAKACHAQRCLI